jgi:hypothetical protein
MMPHIWIPEPKKPLFPGKHIEAYQCMPAAVITQRLPLKPAGSSFPSGASAHWRFEEAAGGPYADATGNGNTLTATGSPTQETGKVGSFSIGNSSGNYASRASTSYLQAGAQDFSISLWVYPTSTANRGYFCKGTEYMLNSDSIVSGMYIQAKNGAGNAYNNATAAGTHPPLNTWSHVCCGYNAAMNKLWICMNAGIMFYSASFTGTGIQTDTGDFFTGRSITDGYSYAGRLDSMTIFNGKLLSAGEISTLYAAGAGLDYS